MSSIPKAFALPQVERRGPRRLRVVDPVQEYVTQRPRTIIGLQRVTKVFKSTGPGGFAAISKLSLDLVEGSSTLITGASGSGKTTLLGLIGCMIRPTAGRIQVHGRDVTRMPEEMLTDIRRCSFGFIFQSSLLVHGMSAIDNVMLPAIPRRDVGSELKFKAQTLLERFELGNRAREHVECLSGGEQQRVAIARSLINDPQIVIADEPTAHLGPHDTQRVLGLFSQLRSEGKTLLVASHDNEILRFAQFSRVITLNNGCLRPEER